MNIESAKLISVLPSTAPVEGGVPFSIHNGSSTGGFADALTGQLVALSETKIQNQLSNQLPSFISPSRANTLPASVVLPENQSIEQNLGCLSGNAMSLPNVVNEAVTEIFNYSPIGEGKKLGPMDVEVSEEAWRNDKGSVENLNSVLSVTEALPSITAHSGQAKIANISEHETRDELLNDKAGLIASLTDFVELAKEADNNLASAHGNPMDQEGQEHENKGEVLGQVLSGAEVLLSAAAYFEEKRVTPTPEYFDQDKIVNNLAHQNGNPKSPSLFLKPLSEELQPNPSESNPVLEETLQKGPEFGQLVKEVSHLPPNPLERTAQSAGLSQIDPQSTVSNVDRSFPQGVAEIAQPTNRQSIDNREVPAMMRSLTHPDWNKDLGERIVWMTNRDMSSAEIKLNPQHLGPISVRIDMNNDQATIAFTAQHAAVKEIIEASLPKLREMMSHQQLNLVDINVSQNNSSDQHQSHSRHSSRNFNSFGQGNGGASDMGEEVENGRTVISKGLLSIYA
ncbi:MAG: flagellar hook-length control protein FliK [Methylosarcina sp.]